MSKLPPVTLDFETYYSKEYSLRKMQTEQYIRSSDFEVIGVGWQEGEGPQHWHTGPAYEIKEALDKLQLSKRAVIAHNMAFDGAILAWRYGIVPARLIDTMAMARPFFGRTVGVSLAAVAKALGFWAKGDEVVQAMGLRRKDFPPDQLQAYGEYCKNDVALTWQVYNALRARLPASEMLAIEILLRMFIEPCIKIDTKLLTDHLVNVREGKKALLRKALQQALKRSPQLVTLMQQMKESGGSMRQLLQSNPLFAEALRASGVEPPTKTSLRTQKQTYAFAKNDTEFKALLEHEDPAVQALVAARMGVKSTLEETRTESMIALGRRGALPILLNYYGAHCVPGDTEVLTREGWVALHTWDGGEIVQWSPDTTLRFLPASKFEGPIVADWIDCQAPYVKAQFTLGHTVPYRKHSSKRHADMLAEGFLSRQSSYLPNAGVLRDAATISAAQTRVLVMVQADGSYELKTRVGRRLTIFIKKARKVARARMLLAAAGVPFVEQVYPSHPDMVRFIVRWVDLPDWLTPERKVFGPWVLQCPPKEFCEELINWDGWAQGGQAVYSSSEKQNAEWVTTMAHLAGQGASIHTKQSRGNRKIIYCAALRNRDECLVKRKHIARMYNPQKAYCAITQTGYWLARANGRIFVTGNTGRASGSGGVNLQNFPRKGPLRQSLAAPAGHVIIAGDSSQIEARMLGYAAGQDDLIEAFANGEDVYSLFASSVYGYTVTKDTHPEERFIGKTAILGLGYGMGHVKFNDTVWTSAGIDLGLDRAKDVVNIYRAKYDKIKAYWRIVQKALDRMETGAHGEIPGPVPLRYEGNTLFLPNGMPITYNQLRRRLTGDDGQELIYTEKRGPTKRDVKIYGGKGVENIIQALARIVVFNQMAEIFAKLRALEQQHGAWGRHFKVVLTVHDEVVACVPEEFAAQVTAMMKTALRRAPAWAPGLPLDCEVKSGRNYGECK